jgi:hypothetical protein
MRRSGCLRFVRRVITMSVRRARGVRARIAGGQIP